jgi:hypothetical protein
MSITETKKGTIAEVSKSQNIRLLDVFFIGPFMIYIGYKAKGLTNLERYMMYGLGIATIYYNGKNYLSNK